MQTTIAHGRVYTYSHVIGRVGSYPPGFNFPVSLALRDDDLLYVLCRSSNSVWNPYVLRVSLKGKPGDEQMIDSIGAIGEDEGNFMWPAAIALDKAGNLYVSDEYMHMISVWDRDGKFQGRWGTRGSQAGEFNGPSGLAFDAEENLWVVDSLNHRVQTYTKDGKFLNQWGTHGSGQGELNMPWGITIDEKGDVFVADWKNHRVQKFTTSGTFLAQIGWPAPKAGELGHPEYDSYPHDEAMAHFRRPGEGNGELNHPTGITVDSDGDVYVANWGNEQVQIYAQDGEYITSLTGDAREVSAWGELQLESNPDIAKARRRADKPEHDWHFHLPTAVLFDAKTDRLLVADTVRRRVQIYNKEKDYTEPQLTL